MKNDPSAEVAAAEPIELTGPYSIEVAGRVCATGWRIGAGFLIDADPPFAEYATIDESPDNPNGDPGVAAQNTFTIRPETLGEYVIEARLTYPNGGVELVYWPVRVAVPDVAEAHLSADPSGAPVAMAVGCGRSIEYGDGRRGYEICAGRTEPPDSPAIRLAAGETLHADLGGLAIVGWSVAYADPTLGDVWGDLTSGYSGVGLAALEIPAPPSGDWSLRVSLSYRDAGGNTFSVPYVVRLGVTGDAASSGSP